MLLANYEMLTWLRDTYPQLYGRLLPDYGRESVYADDLIINQIALHLSQLTSDGVFLSSDDKKLIDKNLAQAVLLAHPIGLDMGKYAAEFAAYTPFKGKNDYKTNYSDEQINASWLFSNDLLRKRGDVAAQDIINADTEAKRQEALEVKRLADEAAKMQKAADDAAKLAEEYRVEAEKQAKIQAEIKRVEEAKNAADSQAKINAEILATNLARNIAVDAAKNAETIKQSAIVATTEANKAIIVSGESLKATSNSANKNVLLYGLGAVALLFLLRRQLK
jgi:membrane-associated HD superfamily phosphohydrolase